MLCRSVSTDAAREARRRESRDEPGVGAHRNAEAYAAHPDVEPGRSSQRFLRVTWTAALQRHSPALGAGAIAQNVSAGAMMAAGGMVFTTASAAGAGVPEIVDGCDALLGSR